MKKRCPKNSQNYEQHDLLELWAEWIKVSNIYDWTSVRLVELYFCRFMDRAARSIDLKKKNEANIIQYGPNRLV